MEQQQLSNRLQISALQSKLDETRHCYHDNTRDPTQELRDALDAARQSLHIKEQEVCRILSEASAWHLVKIVLFVFIWPLVPPPGANMQSKLKSGIFVIQTSKL